MIVASMEDLETFNDSKAALSGSETTVETTVGKRGRTPESLLRCLSQNPDWTLQQVSDSIHKSIRVVEKTASKLVADGRLRHLGPKKGGHWEVVEK